MRAMKMNEKKGKKLPLPSISYHFANTSKWMPFKNFWIHTTIKMQFIHQHIHATLFPMVGGRERHWIVVCTHVKK